MTNMIKGIGIVFLPIESKRQLKYKIIKSNIVTVIKVCSTPKIQMAT